VSPCRGRERDSKYFLIVLRSACVEHRAVGAQTISRSAVLAEHRARVGSRRRNRFTWWYGRLPAQEGKVSGAATSARSGRPIAPGRSRPIRISAKRSQDQLAAHDGSPRSARRSAAREGAAAGDTARFDVSSASPSTLAPAGPSVAIRKRKLDEGPRECVMELAEDVALVDRDKVPEQTQHALAGPPVPRHFFCARPRS